MQLWVVLPLRIPLEGNLDLQGPLSAWLDWCEQNPLPNNGDTEQQPPPRPDLTADECQGDLRRLSHLRAQVCAALSQETYEAALEALPEMQEYAAALQEFEHRGFVLPSAVAGDSLDLAAPSSLANTPPSPLIFRWTTIAMSKSDPHVVDHVCDSYGSLQWERANVVWNIVTLEAFRATRQHLSTKVGWVKAGEHFSYAAATLRQLRSELYPELVGQEQQEETSQWSSSQPWIGLALSHAVLSTWESFLLAQAQRAAYEAYCAVSRPRQFMLAKLAAGAVPLFQDVEDMLSQRPRDDLAAVASGERKDTILEHRLEQWEDAVRAWGMWMSSMMEYHQSMEHRERQEELGNELARLEGALRFGRLCQDFCESTEFRMEGMEKMEDLLHQMRVRQEDAERLHSGPIPDREDLPEIPLQQSVKMDADVSKVLPALSRPFFTSVMDPVMRYYVQIFRSEMEKAVFQTAQLGDEKTESARKALALVNLPHSLTAYRQEQSGGGIPDDLWERIELVQREARDDRLKRDLWELRDLAESARSTYKSIETQLEEDLQMDSLFREQHSNFDGHDVPEIQKSFLQSLKHYDRLMVSAEESDALLLQKCEILDTDAKFRLLKFQKSQLDRLLPGRASGPEIDVSSLSKHLVDLSELFNYRESLIHELREGVKTYNIAAQLSAVPTTGPPAESEYQRIVDEACSSFDSLIGPMHDSIDRQDSLLDLILKENEDFMRARENQSNTQSENFIVKIEDALEEIDHFSEHLREGRAFYDVIIPKLEKLKQQVGDVSARLTIERCEFEDRLRRNRQEAEDARMAASLNQNTSSSQVEYSGSGDASGGSRPQANPGVESISHSQPDVRVDDEKVASLVAMDFDPEKVVAALRKYDNDVDQALNDLLMG